MTGVDSIVSHFPGPIDDPATVGEPEGDPDVGVEPAAEEAEGVLSRRTMGADSSLNDRPTSSALGT